MELTAISKQNKQSILYIMVWRWHFYAGLLVIPFLLVLSVTGTIMLYDQQLQNLRYTSLAKVSSNGEMLSAQQLLSNIKISYPQASVKKYMPGNIAEQASFFVINQEDSSLHVALDPYTGEVLEEINRDDSWYALANAIHGSLLLGQWGDYAIEAATGLIVLLIMSGLYLWYGSRQGGSLVFFPRLNQGKRIFYKQLHSSLGLYCFVFLIFFVISGLSWSGVWGAKLVQAWNSFPAQKWSYVELSEHDHASLNQGVMEEVPWNLEQTALPLSRIVYANQAQPFDLNGVVAIAEQLGMGNYQINLPATKEAVYTLSADTMSGDVSDPRLDRTVHIDQNTGEVLVDIGWSEYTLMAKFMAAAIGLHQGGLGWVNLLFNTLLCACFILISLSGLYLCWLRRPKNSWSLAPKSIPTTQRWFAGIVAVIVVSILFPLSGALIAAMLMLDAFVFILKSMFSK
jgi:uncharacterized iron-regulated membrane protein